MKTVCFNPKSEELQNIVKASGLSFFQVHFLLSNYWQNKEQLGSVLPEREVLQNLIRSGYKEFKKSTMPLTVIEAINSLYPTPIQAAPVEVQREEPIIQQNTPSNQSSDSSKLFNKQDKELKKGSVVEYNGEKYLFWNQNSSGKAQLVKGDGTKFSGTPNIDKLKVLGSFKTVLYNNMEYIVTDKGNIYSGQTGNIVYVGLDNSSITQKNAIINKATQEQGPAANKKTINVYWGQTESETSTKILSNLAPRKFSYTSTDGISREYGSVEHAYQSNKNGIFDKKTYDAYVAKGGYGVKIAPILTEEGKKNSLQLMKNLVVESFIQNPQSSAAKKLLEYEEFTHNTNEIIDQAFLEGLKLAQKELLTFTQDSKRIDSTSNQNNSNNSLASYTNYSGGAAGADNIWEKIGKEFGLGKQVNYRPESLQRLTKEQLQEVENAYQQAVIDLGRTPLSAASYAGGLVRRDYLQAKAADEIFAIGTIIAPNKKDSKGYINNTNEAKVAGGTGYAVQMAINLGKPVYVFDQNKDKWYTWKGNTFVEFQGIPVLTAKFAGIGTREIRENGITAIREVYENTIKSTSTINTNTSLLNSSNINNIVVQTSIPQNLVSGIESFGTKQEANAKAKELLGSNPHSIDMIEAGIRTRTTRSVGEMEKYNIKVGDIVKQFGKSSDGSTKVILTKVTAIYPKGTPEFINTWYKEGWTQEGVEAIKRYKDGAAAIEFEVILDQKNDSPQKQQITETNSKNSNRIQQVTELFDSTPELANQVYTTLGIKNNKIEILKSDYTRQSVQQDTDSLYLFTDNAERTSRPTATVENVDKNGWYYKKYKSQTNKPIHFGSLNNPSSAVMRGLNNAYPISTMSAYGTDWTDANFGLFKTIIDDEIAQIKKDLPKFSKIKISNSRIGQGGKFASLPEQHQAYLDSKLLEIGIDNTDTTPKIVNNQVTQQQRQQAAEIYSNYLDTIFPNSKVKDIVYHGTPYSFDKFDASLRGTNTGKSITEEKLDSELATFFTDNEYTAHSYSLIGTQERRLKIASELFNLSISSNLQKDYDILKTQFPEVVPQLKSLKESGLNAIQSIETLQRKYSEMLYTNIINQTDYLKRKKNISTEDRQRIQKEIDDAIKEGGFINNIKKVVLNIQNPIIKDFNGQPFVDQPDGTLGAKKELTSLINIALENSNDSVIAKNVKDPGLGTNYAILDNNNIHILGSKQDIEGFKKFVNNKTTDTPVKITDSFIEENLKAKGNQGAAQRWYSSQLPEYLDNNLIDKQSIDYAKTLLDIIKNGDLTKNNGFALNDKFSEIVNKLIPYLRDISNRVLGMETKLILEGTLKASGENNESRTLDFIRHLKTKSYNEVRRIIINFAEYTLNPQFNISKQDKEQTIKLLNDFIAKYSNKSDQETINIFASTNENEVSYQLPQGREQEEFVASEKTIRDLAARMSDRIGIPVKYISDRSQQFKGKLENGTAVINLAYATLDTPIHEILGHPIIRAIKQRGGSNTLYQNLLKELEYGKGKEILDRVKRDYKYKENTNRVGKVHPKSDYYFVFDKNNTIISAQFNSEQEANNELEKYDNTPYTLEEQQEEALVELLGLMTAEKLDKVKDGKLISLLKRLLKEIKAFMKQLLGQKEVEIDRLPDNMTLGNIADLLAYSNSKLILPGYEVIYTTPDNQQFKTYQEASNHISQLAKSAEDVDLVDLAVNISIENIDKEIETLQKELDNFKFEIEPFNKFVDVYTNKGRLRQNYWARKKDGTTGWTGGAKETLLEPEYDGFVLDINRGDGRFITKISDEEAEKLYYAQENKFNIATKASREKYEELETKIHNLKNNSLKGFIEKNKEYEQVKEIIEEWIRVNNIQYNPEEVYSRGQEFVSVVGAYSDFDINLMMQNLLQHIEDNQKAGGEFTISAFTKPIDKRIGHLEGGGGKIKFKIYPQSQDIKWAANTDVFSGSVWDASEKVSKDKKSELLGVSYTKFPSVVNLYDIQPNLANIIEDLSHHHNELGISLTGSNFRLEYDNDIPYSTKKIVDSINSILDEKYGKIVKPEIKEKEYDTNEFIIYSNGFKQGTAFKDKNSSTGWSFKNESGNIKELTKEQIIKYKPKGIQPTQTNETLKESIESVRIRLFNQNHSEFGSKYPEEDMEFKYPELYLKKEYTTQALINTKVAKLKNVAKKYPRSLIRSEVRPINSNSNLGFTKSELPFQKVSNDSFQQSQQKFAEDNKDAKYQQIEKLFEENPELANQVYKVLGFNNYELTMDSFMPKKHWKIGHIIDNPTEAANICDNTQIRVLNYILDKFGKPKEKGTFYAKPVTIWAKSPINDKQIHHYTVAVRVNNKVYLYDMPQSEYIEYVSENKGKVIKEYRPRLIEYTPTNLQFYYGTSNENLHIQDEVILTSDLINLNQLTSQQKQQAIEFYSQYLDTIFPDSRVKNIVYHGTNRKFDKFELAKSDFEFRNDMNVRNFFHFTSFNNPFDYFRIGSTVKSAIINITNPVVVDGVSRYNYDSISEDDFRARKGDGIVLNIEEDDVFSLSWNHELDGQSGYTVFKPEQIHILGSKQDIEGFKNYVNNKSKDSPIFVVDSSAIDTALGNVIESNGEAKKYNDNLKECM